MASTFTATAHPEARPPYVELKYDSGTSSTVVVGVSITRNGDTVRVPASVALPAQVVTWRDYDAPFDVPAVYAATVQTQSSSLSGVVDENWQGTLSSKGWGTITLTQATNARQRINLCTTPSFEGGAVGAWAAVGDTVLTASSTAAFNGTKSLKVTPQSVITNLMTNPSLEDSSHTGWSAGGNVASVARVSGGARGSFSLQATTDTQASGATMNSYVNGPALLAGVVQGKTHYVRFSIYQDPDAAFGTALTGDSIGILRWYNSSNVQIGSDINFAAASFGNRTWLTRSLGYMPPAGATKCAIYLGLRWTNNYSNPAATKFRIDQVAISTLNGYFDGDTPDDGNYLYAWTGPAGLSTSTRTARVTNAGAQITLTGLNPGATYTFTPYVLGISGGTANISLKIQADTSILTTLVPGAESTSWQRPTLTFTMPSGAGAPTSATFTVLFSDMGFTGDRFIDAILIEETDFARPYFDGTNSLIPTDALGTWSVVWASTTEASASYARFSTVVTNGSAIRTFSAISSGITFHGFSLTDNPSATITVTLTMADASVLTITATRVINGVEFKITGTTAFALFTRPGTWSGQISLAFLNGRAFLNSAETGASVSVPTTSVTINTLKVAMSGAGETLMPLSVLPGVTITNDTGGATTTLSPDGAWLIHPYTPGLSLEVDAGQEECGDLFVTAEAAKTMVRETVTSLLVPIGASRQIAVSLGGRKDPAWTLTLGTQSADAYDALIALLADSAPLRFDYPLDLGPLTHLCESPTMRIPKGWFSPGDLTETRIGTDWRQSERTWSMPLAPVTAPAAIPAA